MSRYVTRKIVDRMLAVASAMRGADWWATTGDVARIVNGSLSMAKYILNVLHGMGMVEKRKVGMYLYWRWVGGPPPLPEQYARVLEALRARGTATATQLAKETGMSPGSVYRILRHMDRLGLVARTVRLNVTWWSPVTGNASSRSTNRTCRT